MYSLQINLDTCEYFKHNVEYINDNLSLNIEYEFRSAAIDGLLKFYNNLYQTCKSKTHKNIIKLIKDFQPFLIKLIKNLDTFEITFQLNGPVFNIKLIEIEKCQSPLGGIMSTYSKPLASLSINECFKEEYNWIILE